jgi:hypothetical protein
VAEVAAIRFTQEQTRTLTGVSPETIRHWRKVVPYLRAKPGKSARFTFADIVGLAVTREFTATFGVHITNVSAGVNALFEVLAETRPTLFENAIAVVTAAEASLFSAEDFTGRRLDAPVLLVPLGPLIARLRHHMVPVPPPSEQASLPFPPRMVRSGT